MDFMLSVHPDMESLRNKVDPYNVFPDFPNSHGDVDVRTLFVLSMLFGVPWCANSEQGDTLLIGKFTLDSGEEEFLVYSGEMIVGLIEDVTHNCMAYISDLDLTEEEYMLFAYMLTTIEQDQSVVAN